MNAIDEKELDRIIEKLDTKEDSKEEEKKKIVITPPLDRVDNTKSKR